MSDQTTSSATDQSEGVPGVGMLLAAYVDEMAADQTLEEMNRAKKQGTFYFDDAAVIRQDPKGQLHIKETGDMSTGKGAGIGAFIGGVVGLLGGPAGVALGAGAGAAIGGISSHHDGGFSQKSLKEIGGALLPGTSAIVATTSKAFVEEARKQTPESESLSLARDLAAEIHERLSERQDVLFGLIITETSIAAQEIVSSPSMVAVFGIAASDEGVVAGRAVATDQGVAYEIAAEDETGAVYEAGVATSEGAAIVDVVVPADDQIATVDAEEGEESDEKPDEKSV